MSLQQSFLSKYKPDQPTQPTQHFAESPGAEKFYFKCWVADLVLVRFMTLRMPAKVVSWRFFCDLDTSL
jgi:hypothetical protein